MRPKLQNAFKFINPVARKKNLEWNGPWKNARSAIISQGFTDFVFIFSIFWSFHYSIYHTSVWSRAVFIRKHKGFFVFSLKSVSHYCFCMCFFLKHFLSWLWKQKRFLGLDFSAISLQNKKSLKVSKTKIDLFLLSSREHWWDKNILIELFEKIDCNNIFLH